jgi:hypothetical protein
MRAGRTRCGKAGRWRCDNDNGKEPEPMKTNTSMTSSTWKLALVLVFLAIATTAHAAQKELTQRQIASIKSQIPEAEEVFEYAGVGSLRNDAGTYFVVTYETREDRLRNEQEESSGSYENISRCAIFGAQDNKLVLFARSGELLDYPRSGKDFVGCKIALGNVEIHHSNNGGYCSDFNEMWKFNLSDGQFILIGYDSVYSGCSGCEMFNESEIFTESVKSVNFLTNEARLWRKTGKPSSGTNRWRRVGTIKNVIKYKEISVYFELDEPFVFELFDIEAFKAWMSQNKDLCGYIDEHYKYVPCKPV